MKCTDCNGTKQYLGAAYYTVPEACWRCKGTGLEPGQPQTPAASSGINQTDSADRADWGSGTLELLSREETILRSDKLQPFPGMVRLPEARDVVTCRRIFTLAYNFTIDNKPIEIENPDGPHWLYIGVRPNAEALADQEAIDWSSRNLAQALALEHAQRHYLALYQRVMEFNKFVCIWHY